MTMGGKIGVGRPNKIVRNSSVIDPASVQEFISHIFFPGSLPVADLDRSERFINRSRFVINWLAPISMFSGSTEDGFARKGSKVVFVSAHCGQNFDLGRECTAAVLLPSPFLCNILFGKCVHQSDHGKRAICGRTTKLCRERVLCFHGTVEHLPSDGLFLFERFLKWMIIR